MNDLLTIKELAAALKRSRFYVHAMKRRGFQMPGGVATVAEARFSVRLTRAPAMPGSAIRVRSTPEMQAAQWMNHPALCAHCVLQ